MLLCHGVEFVGDRNVKIIPTFLVAWFTEHWILNQKTRVEIFWL